MIPESTNEDRPHRRFVSDALEAYARSQRRRRVLLVVAAVVVVGITIWIATR